MARALEPAELAYLLDERQRTDLFLAVLVPEVVFTARVVGAHDADRLAIIEYNLGSGAGDFADVLADMTLYVGSTAGAFDRGMARLRQVGDDLVNDWYEPGSGGITGDMRIGETSEIDVQAGDFLTVVDEFQLWPKPLRILADGTIYMDYEVPYVDEHLYPQPVPVMGPHACAWLPAGGTADVLFDATAPGKSWSPIAPGVGYTFVWTCAGAAGIVGGNTATPTITFNATRPQHYRVNCRVTADYGGGNTAVFTGYRRVFVFDDDNMPLVEFTLDDCSGSWREGGWSFRITMYDQARVYEPLDPAAQRIRDRALVVLFARDWYGDTEISIGPIEQLDTDPATAIRGNVVASGWIDGESITRNWEQGTVGFTVQGPQHWLAQMTGFPSGLRDTDAPGGPGTPPLAWTDFDDLTVDRGLWHFLHWRSTVTRCIDLRATDDTRQTAYFDAPIGTLWDQLTRTADAVIFARPCCDRYARLFIEVNSQLLPTGARAGIPVVMALTEADWRRRVDIRRHTVSKTGLVDLSGVFYLDGVAAAFFSLAHGHIFKHYGGVRKRPSMALASQAQSNILTGLVLSNDNNEYPYVDIPLRANNRNIDVTPWQYVTMSIAVGDTERGIEWTNKELVPRSVSFQMREGMMLADVEAEAWTDEVDSTDGDIPPEPPPPPDPPPPPPPPPPPILPTALGIMILCQDQIAVSFDAFIGAPVWFDADPSNDLVGQFLSLAVTGLEAYVTTRDDANQANTGLWYCADISAAADASITWALIESVHDAVDDGVGYVKDSGTDSCCFGALDTNDAGQVGALIHSMGNRPPLAGSLVSGIYIGSGGVVAMSLFGNVAANFPFFQEGSYNACLHSVWGKGGSWYVAGRDSRTRAYLAVGPAWVYTDFWTVPGETRLNAAAGDVSGYVIAHGGQVYQNWNPAAPVVGVIVWPQTGIFEDDTGAHRIYIDGAPYDLYYDDGLIGDATTAASGFGAGRLGSMAQFVPASGLEIVWIVGNGATFGTHRAIIYTDDAGVNWQDKTGNLAAALGAAAWNGWSGATVANSIARIFEH